MHLLKTYLNTDYKSNMMRGIIALMFSVSIVTYRSHIIASKKKTHNKFYNFEEDMKKEQTNKRKQQAIKTKRKIFEAASQLAAEHGIENVSVDSIVEAAGVSKGAFYVYYESKDALIVDLVNDFTNIADKDYKSFLLSLPESESSLDILHLLVERISDFIESNIGLDNMKILYKAHLTKTIYTGSAMDYSRDLYKMFADILEKGVQEGELREDIPIDSLSKHLILAIRGVVFEWCIRYPNFELKGQIRDHFRILLYGLKR
ncbi:MAG TPA: TetR/AcrR family transcriptional regulator [Clostridiales bacterium]|nr:TetR/AcrR family transcriptional regulator [Clostridiales bacterium]